jgi:hypothetical protein
MASLLVSPMAVISMGLLQCGRCHIAMSCAEWISITRHHGRKHAISVHFINADYYTDVCAIGREQVGPKLNHITCDIRIHTHYRSIYVNLYAKQLFFSADLITFSWRCGCDRKPLCGTVQTQETAASRELESRDVSHPLLCYKPDAMSQVIGSL